MKMFSQILSKIDYDVCFKFFVTLLLLGIGYFVRKIWNYVANNRNANNQTVNFYTYFAQYFLKVDQRKETNVNIYMDGKQSDHNSSNEDKTEKNFETHGAEQMEGVTTQKEKPDATNLSQTQIRRYGMRSLDSFTENEAKLDLIKTGFKPKRVDSSSDACAFRMAMEKRKFLEKFPETLDKYEEKKNKNRKGTTDEVDVHINQENFVGLNQVVRINSLKSYLMDNENQEQNPVTPTRETTIYSSDDSRNEFTKPTTSADETDTSFPKSFVRDREYSMVKNLPSLPNPTRTHYLDDSMSAFTEPMRTYEDENDTSFPRSFVRDREYSTVKSLSSSPNPTRTHYLDDSMSAFTEPTSTYEDVNDTAFPRSFVRDREYSTVKSSSSSPNPTRTHYLDDSMSAFTEPMSTYEVKAEIQYESLEEYITENATDPFAFSVDREGCRVTAPYCKLLFPPGAVRRRIDIIMSVLYYSEVGYEGVIFITPHIKFSSKDVMTFERDVHVALYTSYEAADLREPVPIQILRANREEDPFDTIGRFFLKNERFISFTCQHFCRFCARTSETNRRILQRRYYSAAYLRNEKTKNSRIVHWTIYEDIPDTRQDKLKHLEKKAILVDPQCFTIRCEHDLQLKLKRPESDVTVTPVRRDIQLNRFFGRKVDKSRQFTISLAGDTVLNDANLEFNYEIIAIDPITNAIIVVERDDAFLIWNEDKATFSDQHNYHINVGADGIGVKNDITLNESIVETLLGSQN